MWKGSPSLLRFRITRRSCCCRRCAIEPFGGQLALAQPSGAPRPMKPQWATIGRWGLFFLLLAAPSIVELSAKAEETSSPARDIDPEALVRKLTVAVQRDAPDTVLRLLDGVDAEEICFSPLHEAALEAGDRFRDCLMCPKMVVVPAGSFLMASPQDEEGREEVEGPQHAVTIPRPFAVGVYEVTLREWCAYRDGRVCSSVPRAYCPCAAYDERTGAPLCPSELGQPYIELPLQPGEVHHRLPWQRWVPCGADTRCRRRHGPCGRHRDAVDRRERRVPQRDKHGDGVAHERRR